MDATRRLRLEANLGLRSGSGLPDDRSGQRPGLAILVVQEPIGFVAGEEAFGLRVTVEALACGQGDVGQMREGGRSVALLDIGRGASVGLDAVEEVAGGLLVEVAVGRLDDLLLAPGIGILKCTAALGYDLIAAAAGIR